MNDHTRPLLYLKNSFLDINNISKFIGQIATYEVNKNITDCIVFLNTWNGNEINATTKGVQNNYLIYEYTSIAGRAIEKRTNA